MYIIRAKKSPVREICETVESLGSITNEKRCRTSVVKGSNR
jgi:hypothetical protein